VTSTIYHFGFDKFEARIVGYAYGSINNFVSEKLPYAVEIKPNPENANFEIKSFPDDFIQLAKWQKQLDESKPVTERVGVGGHLIAYMLQRFKREGDYEVLLTVKPCYEFPDSRFGYLEDSAKLPSKK
jgi:hypothetical protein